MSPAVALDMPDQGLPPRVYAAGRRCACGCGAVLGIYNRGKFAAPCVEARRLAELRAVGHKRARTSAEKAAAGSRQREVWRRRRAGESAATKATGLPAADRALLEALARGVVSLPGARAILARAGVTHTGPQWRLLRRGLMVRDVPDSRRAAYYAITDAGRAALAEAT